MSIKYRDWAPTGFDARGLSLPERQDWLVAPVSSDRDTADALTLANWETIQGALGDGPSETTWEIHRFGHWGHGWFEVILVHPDLAEALEEIEGALENYPCLDDERLSEKEMELAEEAWPNIWREVCAELREYPSPDLDDEDLVRWEEGEGRVRDAEDYCDDLPEQDCRALFEKALEKAGGMWQWGDEGAYVTRSEAQIVEELVPLLCQHWKEESGQQAFEDAQLKLEV